MYRLTIYSFVFHITILFNYTEKKILKLTDESILLDILVILSEKFRHHMSCKIVNKTI